MDYETEDRLNLIQQWYEVQDDAVKVAFDYTLRILAATEDWNDSSVKEFKVLTRKHVGLCEIRFKTDARHPNGEPYKRRFRPVGVWRPDSRDFVLLLGCEKWGMNYIPPNAFDLALDYKTQYFEQGRGAIYEHI